MLFTETTLKGAYVIDLERRADSRGFFARGLCQGESAAHGLKPIIAQASVCLQREERDITRHARAG
jgi:dTDP-4-dehydrorhamnose 3,5-epimerase